MWLSLSYDASPGGSTPGRRTPPSANTGGLRAEKDSEAEFDARGRPVSHACRFWALIGRDYPADLIRMHLRDGSYQNLRALGQYYDDGWGFGSFLAGTDSTLLRLPLLRRGRPAADDPAEAEYSLVVDELGELRPRAVLGHIRRASSGHWGIPDPHPFQQERWIFAQNGTLSTDALDSLLTWDDPEYLLTHPPEYVTGWIDSELYFLYVLKLVHRSPGEFEAAVCEAVRDVDAANGGVRRLNFVMTEGDTLWAVRCASGDDNDPVVYAPHSGGEPPPYWVVASQALGNSSLEWAVVPPRTLGVFVPGTAPRFFSIDATPPPTTVPEPPGSPGILHIGSARPNPTDQGVLVPVTVAGRGSGTLAETVPAGLHCEIFGPSGRLVRSLCTSAPASALRWDGCDADGRRVAPGTYFLRLQAGGQTAARKVVVLPGPR